MFKLILLYASLATNTFNEKVYDVPVDNMAACLIAAPTLERQFHIENQGTIVLAATCIADPEAPKLPTL